MIKFRNANYDDLELLQYWDTLAHVKASDPEKEDWEYELKRNPEWRELLIAQVDEKPIGVVQIIDPANEDTHYWGKIAENKRAIDIWIGEEAYLNKGYGTEMMRQAIAKCFAPEEVDEIVIDPLASNKRAIRFYQRLGFEFVEKRTFNHDECEVYSLKRERWLSG